MSKLIKFPKNVRHYRPSNDPFIVPISEYMIEKGCKEAINGNYIFDVEDLTKTFKLSKRWFTKNAEIIKSRIARSEKIEKCSDAVWLSHNKAGYLVEFDILFAS